MLADCHTKTINSFKKSEIEAWRTDLWSMVENVVWVAIYRLRFVNWIVTAAFYWRMLQAQVNTVRTHAHLPHGEHCFGGGLVYVMWQVTAVRGAAIPPTSDFYKTPWYVHLVTVHWGRFKSKNPVLAQFCSTKCSFSRGDNEVTRSSPGRYGNNRIIDASRRI